MDQSSLLLLTEKHKDGYANFVGTEISLLLDKSTDSEVEVLEEIRICRRSEDNCEKDITILYENHSLTEKQKLIKSAIKNRCFVKIKKMEDADAAKYLNEMSSNRSGSLDVGEDSEDSSRASKENSSDNLIEYEQRVKKHLKNLLNPKRGRPLNIKPKTEKEEEAYSAVFEEFDFEANLYEQDGTGQTLVDLQPEALKKSDHNLPLLPKQGMYKENFSSAIEDRAGEADLGGVATDQVQVEAGKNLAFANKKSGADETIEISSDNESDVEIVEDLSWDLIFEENNNDIRLKKVRVMVKNEVTGISAATADKKRKFQPDQASVNIKAAPIKRQKKPLQFEDPKKLSDFEKIREKNIKECKALFASLNFDDDVDELKKASGLKKKKIDQSFKQRSLSSCHSSVVTRKQPIRSKARESDGQAVARKEEHTGENLDKLERNSSNGKFMGTIVDETIGSKNTTSKGPSGNCGKFSAGTFRIPKVKKTVVGCMSFGDALEDASLWEIVNSKEVIGQNDAEELKRINTQYSRLTKLMTEIDPVLKLQTDNEKKIVITDEEEIADLMQIKAKLGDDIDDDRRKKLARESFENEEQSIPQRNLTFHGFQKEVSKLPKSQTEYVQTCEEAMTEETQLKITDVEKVMKKIMKLSYCLKYNDHVLRPENLEKLRPMVGHFKQGSDETATFLRFYSNSEKAVSVQQLQEIVDLDRQSETLAKHYRGSDELYCHNCRTNHFFTL